jgi:hypothetical protein
MAGWLDECGGVRVKDGDSIEPEAGGDEFQQPLSDRGEPDAAGRLALERGHRLCIAVAANVPEGREVRVGVQNHPEARDAVADSNADVCQAAAVDTDTGAIRIGGAGETVVAGEFEGDFFERGHVTCDGRSGRLEGEDRVAGNLPG